MATRHHDPIGTLEAIYATELPAEPWLRLVTEKIRPIMDRDGLGMAAGLYSCPDPCSFAPSHALLCDVPEQAQAAFFTGLKDLSPIYVADSFLSRSCYLGSEVRGWSDISTVRSGALEDCGIVDSIQLNVVEPDGQGCWFCSPLAQRTPVPDDAYLVLTRIVRHLAAAHRLRRKYGSEPATSECADAVFDRSGGVRRARGGAAEPSCLDELACGVRAIGVARSRPAGADPAEAIERWPSVVAGRWTLVDDVEGGRSFILAVENGAKVASIDLLSPREREVVLRALRGQANKSIAYEMGLAQSTVRVLVARAATKVGARSRRELLEMVARVGLHLT